MSDGFSSTLSLTNFSAGDEGRKSYRSSMLQSYQPSAFTGAPMENDVDNSAEYERIVLPSNEELAEDTSESVKRNGTISAAPQSFPVKRSTYFNFQPEFYANDLKSVDEVRAMNPDIEEANGKTRPATWPERLDFSAHPDSYGVPFKLKFPLKTHELQEVIFSNLTFMLPKQSDTIDTFVQRMEENNGEIHMKYSEDQLKQQFGSVPHLAHHTGHIIPKTIKIVSEFANLPIDCQVTLQSSILNPSDGRIKKYTVWSRVMGAHNGGDKANAGVSHIVPRKIETCSTTESSVLFIANEHVHNHPDFYRWLNVDPKEIFSAIEKRVKPGAPDTVQIRCGPDDMILPDDILQFVVIDDNAALTKLSEQYDHPIPMITQNEHGQKVHEVSRKALEKLISSIYERVDRNKTWMNLKNLTLILKPLRTLGGQGMDDLRKIAKDIMKHCKPGCHEWYYPSYMCTIEIAYNLCDHEYSPVEEKSKSVLTIPQKTIKSNVSYPLPKDSRPMFPGA